MRRSVRRCFGDYAEPAVARWISPGTARRSGLPTWQSALRVACPFQACSPVVSQRQRIAWGSPLCPVSVGFFVTPVSRCSRRQNGSPRRSHRGRHEDRSRTPGGRSSWAEELHGCFGGNAARCRHRMSGSWARRSPGAGPRPDPMLRFLQRSSALPSGLCRVPRWLNATQAMRAAVRRTSGRGGGSRRLLRLRAGAARGFGENLVELFEARLEAHRD